MSDVCACGSKCDDERWCTWEPQLLQPGVTVTPPVPEGHPYHGVNIIPMKPSLLNLVCCYDNEELTSPLRLSDASEDWGICGHVFFNGDVSYPLI